MQYCPKCHRVFSDEREVCLCGRKMKSYDELREDTPVFIVRASGFEKDRIGAALTDAELSYSETPAYGKDVNEIAMGQGEVPADFCVPYRELDKARALLRGIGALNAETEHEMETSETLHPPAEENIRKTEGPWEEMSRKKRWLWRIVSIVLFILVVWAVVSGTDWVMGALMGKS